MIIENGKIDFLQKKKACSQCRDGKQYLYSEICSNCTGKKRGVDNCKCSTCKGKGYLFREIPLEYGKCGYCRGTGEVFVSPRDGVSAKDKKWLFDNLFCEGSKRRKEKIICESLDNGTHRRWNRDKFWKEVEYYFMNTHITYEMLLNEKRELPEKIVVHSQIYGWYAYTIY